VINRSKIGKRNRQRGAELQRAMVNLAKKFKLEAHNRDRGGAQHPDGDIEINKLWFGCKRKKRLPRYLFPEKSEKGVFIRSDREKPMVVINAELFMMLYASWEKDHETKLNYFINNGHPPIETDGTAYEEE
tara:strand:- start:754 stop:1146 length:393 start_codon:yes stop_codon:yes gene_type:complete